MRIQMSVPEVTVDLFVLHIALKNVGLMNLHRILMINTSVGSSLAPVCRQEGVPWRKRLRRKGKPQ